MPTTLESLHQAVESRCNSDEGLLRLVQALLEHQPKLSDAARDYVAALVYYTFHSRRREHWRRTGNIMSSPCGINSGYGPSTDLELARDNARLKEGILRGEMSTEEIQEIKNSIGRLGLHGILQRIITGNYDAPTKRTAYVEALSCYDRYGDINE